MIRRQGDIETYNKLLEDGFLYVDLIFDSYNSQFSEKKIKEMVDYFDDETGNGKKIYI